MSKLKNTFPLSYQLFMKIAEPRVVRLIHFGIYICMAFAGLGLILQPTERIENIIGSTLVYIVGAFTLTGAIVGAVAVLPGVWWLERFSLILMMTGMTSYVVVIIALGGSTTGIAVSTAFVMTFIIRWLEIRRYQLAPREE